jgi:hypothetical protein
MASLQALEDDVEAFCRGRAQALAEEATGQTARANLATLERVHPLAISPDTLAAVRAATTSAGTPEAQLPRLLGLLPFLAQAAVDAATRQVQDAFETAARATTVSAGGAPWPLAAVWQAVGQEADRTRRAALALAAATAEEARLGEVQRRWEARHAAALALGVTQAPALSGLQAEAVDFLHRTEDGFRDVLAYALRRLEGTLRPLPQGEAALHDVLRLSHQPLPGAFPSTDGLGPVRRWLDASGLTLSAGGRVRVAEAAAGRLPEAESFGLQVPQHVLLVHPGEGSFPQLLAAAGRARALAAVAPDAPLRARRLGDEAVRASAGWLLRGALLSEGWLRRFLGHGRTAAREVARLAALVQLFELRMAAVRLPYDAGLQAAGPSSAALRTLAAAATEALFLRVPEGALVPGLWAGPSQPVQLRAGALAECLRQAADARFDAEDFRNPTAARWLAALWGRGTELDADALAKHVSGAPLSLAAVGQRLLAVLAA